MATPAGATPYFEAADTKRNQLDEMIARGWGRFGPRLMSPLVFRRLERLADDAEAQGRDLRDLSDRRLMENAQALRPRLLREGMAPGPAAAAFAVTREACTRQLGLRHHRVQLIGGGAMLDRTLAEMETGEGKTITALLPTVAYALAGKPVHVVTVNDYLAQRDAEQLRPVYNALGLSVGLVVQGQPPEQRRSAYACDVTYCTNKDLVFDYLRDRLALGSRRARARLLVDELFSGHRGGRLLLRGLHVAIVDEADSILIDEARTPLILSGSDGEEEDAEVYEAALDIARQLRVGDDYELMPQDRNLKLTVQGKQNLQRLVGDRSGLWAARRAREELAERALSALHYYRRDEQYIIVDGKVQIVDEFTGRVMPDRAWEHGLHQMVEAKEGCAVTGRRRTLARITYQRFFRRYEHLCGMTGTAAEVMGEMRAVYDLRVLRVPTHHKLQRRDAGARVFADADRKWQAVAASARAATLAGRSVLIGTRWAGAASVGHHAGLAECAAGQAGGGHRDRQLFGRGGRQGDPGSYETIAALDDELFRRFLGPWRWLALRVALPGALPGGMTRWFVRRAQQRAERNNARTRRETLANDLHLDRMLGFAGQGE